MNKQPEMVVKKKPLTKTETSVLQSPVTARGRGTTGGGGKTIDPETARSLMGSRLGGHLHRKQTWILTTPNCGVSEHTCDCLCDVVVKKVSPIMVNMNDMMYASVICEHMGYGVPWTTNKMLDMFSMCARAHDMLSSANGSRTWGANNKVTSEARDYIRDSMDAGVRNKTVIKQVKELFGIEISQSYISKRRYIYTGTKGSDK